VRGFPAVVTLFAKLVVFLFFGSLKKTRNKKKLQGGGRFLAFVTLLAELVAFLFFSSLEYEDTYIAVEGR
jgi:hypothetical protein